MTMALLNISFPLTAVSENDKIKKLNYHYEVYHGLENGLCTTEKR